MSDNCGSGCKERVPCTERWSSTSEVVVPDGSLDAVTISGEELPSQDLPSMQMFGLVGAQRAIPEKNLLVPSLDLTKAKNEVPLQRDPFEVELVREGPQAKQFGFTVGLDDDMSYLTVDAIWSPSLVSAWNRTHSPRQTVNIGDMIMSANGKTGNNEDMLQEIQAVGRGEVLRLRVESGKHTPSRNPQEGSPSLREDSPT